MRRTLAQMICIDGMVHRLAVIVERDGAAPVVETMERETASTEFFNGLIAVVPAGTVVPAGVAATDALTLCKALPRVVCGAPVCVVRVPFV